MKNDEPELRKQKKKKGTWRKLKKESHEKELHGEEEQGELADREDAIKEDSGTFLQYALRHWKILITGMITVGVLALLGAIWLYSYIYTNMRELKHDIFIIKQDLTHYIDNSIALITRK